MADNVVDKARQVCSGCGLCIQVCPTSCLSMTPNSEGFLFPDIDRGACIDCAACVRRCPMLNAEKYLTQGESKSYAAVTQDKEILRESSSGGMFSVLANSVLKRGGAVYGAVLDKDFIVRHQRTVNEEGLRRMRGSKYVQSELSLVYQALRRDLDEGMPVLFSGTPCQVAAITEWTKGLTVNLTTVDLVCHGVPSPGLFQRHLVWLKEHERLEVSDYHFRNKQKAYWGLFKARIDTKSGSVYRLGVSDPYYAAFLRCETFREVCYQCPFARSERVGDLTLCDYWGVEVEHPSFDASLGASGVCINTANGIAQFKRLEHSLISIPTSKERISRYQQNLKEPSIRPITRGNIYEDISANGYSAWATRYLFSAQRLLSSVRSSLPRELKILRRRIVKKFYKRTSGYEE